jgi:hypothetical protein
MAPKIEAQLIRAVIASTDRMCLLWQGFDVGVFICDRNTGFLFATETLAFYSRPKY